MLVRVTKRMKKRSERERKRAVKVRGSEDFGRIEGEFKAVDSVWLSNPADPWAVVRDWRDHGGSRSIPLSAECESSTVIPSTPYTQTHTHLHRHPHTHIH